MRNCVVLIGRLTRNPEIKYLQNGTAVASFTLAVSRKDETDYVDIVVRHGLAENCDKHLKKGKWAIILGKMDFRSYDDKNGQKRIVAEIPDVAADIWVSSSSASSAPTDKLTAAEWQKINKLIPLRSSNQFLRISH